MTWQPIAAYKRENLEDVIVTDGRVVSVAWVSTEGEWNDSINANDGDSSLGYQPTHWMPLPDAPIQSA